MTFLKIIKTGETKSMLDFEELTSGIKICLMKSDFSTVLERFKNWRKDNFATNFTAQLFNLMCHADDVNKIKFLKGFPTETIIFLLWYTSKSGEEEFLREYGNITTEDNERE